MITTELIASYEAAKATWQNLLSASLAARDANAERSSALLAAQQAKYEASISGVGLDSALEAEAMALALAGIARSMFFAARAEANAAKATVNESLFPLQLRRAELKAIESPSDAESAELTAIVAAIGA